MQNNTTMKHMEKNNTAVNYLVEHILLELYLNGNNSYEKRVDLLKHIEKAKEIETKLRTDAYNQGFTDATVNHINDAENFVNEQNYLAGETEIKEVKIPVK